ncbi:MAG: apolipoprotein N-acyltransferase, partial [Alphaproteobacteria bacterium]
MAIVEKVVDKLRMLNGWRQLLSACALGALGALAFPPFYIFPLLLISYAALVILFDVSAKHARPLHRAALIGWSYGFGFF